MAEQQTAGVIHDIGFRHYDGPRLGRGWIVRSLLVETFRGAFGLGRPAKAKAMPWILIGILLAPPVIFVLVIVLTGMDRLPVSYTQYFGSLQLIISLFIAGRAPYAVSRDLRHGVMPLYLSRPLKRGDYVLAKFGGVSLAMFAILAAPETLLFVGALLAKLPVGAQIAGYAEGLAMAVILALMLTGIGLVIAAFTPRRGLGVAAIITTLVVANALGAILSVILSQMGNATLGAYLSAVDPYNVVDGLAGSWFSADTSITALSSLGFTGGLVFTTLAVATVGGSLAILLARYRKVGVV
ncbi:ABC transporter permease [Demequina lutea]|uniref:ABC-2 type transport system permease protein n=1 Tax=Demequina lutea TaxID=431489 RepID=A0A7Z0CJC4_9MICO|nr:ABC transporter permease subunit [Demequina lutea]NYI40768.1 ABC-2 type transport system permease protein [Demequina lutea]